MNLFTKDVIQVVDLSREPSLSGLKLVLFDSSRLPDHMIFDLGKLLSARELRKSARFRFADDRRIYLAGHGVLRKLCCEVLGTTTDKLIFEEGQFGKPYLRDHQNALRFNKTKSGAMIALAFDFSQREVGVDLERIDKNFDYWDVAAHYFSKKECDHIFSHRDFYRYWTMKEALLKVTGAGLVDNLSTLDLSGKMNRVQVCDERLLPFKNKAFTLYTLDNEQIVLSLAVAGAQLSKNAKPIQDSPELAVRHVYFY
ncbi:MAG: 4'-phosphopantetheinyl transferase superfamily protein [Bacteroidetes bacterium]|nr:4'-phosphopantetheinyl transferase superfamily protein [Bacteroidota bacterium]